ncbi:MAG: hypothetical protein ACRENB_16780 [Gemmatimonadales bacterium]
MSGRVRAVWRAARLGLVVLVLLAAAWLGLFEGFNGLRDADTRGQRIASVFQVLYGLAAAGSLVTLFAAPVWTRLTLGVWCVAVTATATMAPIVWGEESWRSGAVAGAATAVFVGLVAWGGLAHVRGRIEPAPTVPPTGAS